jgi:hypothetical protein
MVPTDYSYGASRTSDYSAYELYGDEMDYMDVEEEEDIVRCEADYEGGICLARLVKGRCSRGHVNYCDEEIASTNAYCRQVLETYSSECPNAHLHWSDNDMKARGHKFDVDEEL